MFSLFFEQTNILDLAMSHLFLSNKKFRTRTFKFYLEQHLAPFPSSLPQVALLSFKPEKYVFCQPKNKNSPCFEILQDANHENRKNV